MVDGIIGGVGSVLTFLPIMVIFFASFGLLEDVGYMARAAYVMDNFMHMMGLHGKSFLPIFLGFGCNVPAIMGTRVIDSAPARLLTILIAPLVPCTARMAVLAFIAPAFFGAQAMLVSWGLILLSLVLLVLSGIVLNRILFKGERSAFIMELPLYHIPNGRTIGMLVWQRGLSFVKKAGTIILAMSVGIWALSVLPGGDLQTSYLARLGELLAPVGQLDGHGLAPDGGPADQFPRQRKFDCHAGRAVRRQSGRGPGADPGGHLLSRHGAGLSDRLAAVHPVRGHGGRHPPGNRFVALDAVQRRLYAGPFHRGRQRGVCPGSRDWGSKMLEKLLEEIHSGGTLQPAALAARLKISLGLVQVMLEDLERMGWLTRVNSDCASTCGGCSLTDTCGTQGHAAGKVWM